ncbi:LysR family transcriptional regulator [Aliiglaciecola sp. CAU 1673]|uniref:LysR family transcriptional regulator n=1 Tax=Aliiglaciecola sp. CAU 1673 TaxID=3032595 RepID=UPI0023DBDEA3|nr:LysR family transcriptional regulator [Aliiglaciecola sp. CAU 1673]MDF2178656.1 LysR family transcriptional regulator [Aliiglaciecola sp. CAU 1673]
MDLRALGHFIAVYEQGSLSAASKSRFIAQPSLSAALRQLEEEVGRQLFVRHARGVKATEAAEQLYPLAKQLLGQADAIQAMFAGNRVKEPFRLGLIKGLGVTRMSNLLKHFTSARETMELTLVPPEERCDARLITRDMQVPGEQFIPVWSEQYLLAMPMGHPLGLKDSIQITDLTAQPFIQRTPCEAWNKLRVLLQQQQVSLDIRARIQTIEYALGLVGAGLGIALVPVHQEMLSSQDVRQDIRFCALQGLELVREVGLAYRQETDIVQVLRQLVS